MKGIECDLLLNQCVLLMMNSCHGDDNCYHMRVCTRAAETNLGPPGKMRVVEPIKSLPVSIPEKSVSDYLITRSLTSKSDWLIFEVFIGGPQRHKCTSIIRLP